MMIDMHSHILPQIDDGSKSVQMSVEMLARLKEQSVDTVVATPHFLASKNSPEDFLRNRQEACDRLGSVAADGPQILLGAEVAYFDGIGRCNELERLCLGDSRLILVEMPCGQWTQRMVREVCDIPVQLGLQPVLAHVDRYRKSFTQYYGQLSREGVLFQFNADVFNSFWSRHWALKLLRMGGLHFLGSDCHNLDKRPPNMDRAYRVIAKQLGEGILEDITAFTAQALGL